MIELPSATQREADIMEVSTVSNFSKCMYNSQNQLINNLNKRWKGKAACNNNFGYIDLQGNDEPTGYNVNQHYKLITIQEVNSNSVSDKYLSNNIEDSDSSDYEVDGEENVGKS